MTRFFSFALFSLFALSALAQTNPAITSWVINTTGQTGYNCAGCSPTVAGNIPANVQNVYYDDTYAYIKTQGIPSYNIGPWASNPNTPSAQNKIYRIKLSPTNNGAHTTTPLGNIGIWSNGIGVFNAKDGMSYNNAGVWNRNAYYYEGVSFDACLGHPAPGGNYHNHVNPSCLYDASNTNVHSPIIGYAFDGYPIYGAYGYANADGSGGIKRMVSSYVLSSNTSRVNGPAVNGTYPAGCFCEDYVYTAGAGDLDVYNNRYCVTPEYPDGTYAYFVTINAAGIPQYPFVVGPTYFGTFTMANTVASVPAGAVLYSTGLPVALISFSGKKLETGNQLTWRTAVELDNQGFEVEYSLDGNHFESLGFVPAKAENGHSTVQSDYTFTDTKPAASLVYYRLKQIDLQQSFRYSHIISVKRNAKDLDVRVSPNPVTDQTFYVSVEDVSSDLSIQVYNTQGRILINRQLKAGEYEREIPVNAPFLGAGLYWLILDAGGNRTAKTILFDAEE